MANYTVELRTLVEGGHNIFDFHYPFYNEDKRREFEEKFIRHFYFREIGCETVDRFKLYLQDKMTLVFPYYNELFNAAEIEYNVLDNYNIKEEYTIEREGKENKGSVSSSVGQTYDEQASETKDSSESEGKTTGRTSDSRSDMETGKTTSEGSDTRTENSSENGTASSSGSNTSEGSESGNSNRKQWYLDTPQGKIDNLSKSNYITNFTENEDQTGKNTSAQGTAASESSSEISKNATSEGVTSSEANSERNLTSNSEGESNVDVTSKNDSSSNTKFSGEQRSTFDNNTRSETRGTQIEKSVYTKKGNIGVDTDSDMIHKHISLQKVLRKIELMFFEECEDLFMLVY